MDVLPTESPALRTIRRALLALLVVAFVGTLVELVLLEHDEDPYQLIPLAVVSLGLVALAWTGIRPGPAALAAFRTVMVLLIASGALGLVLHYRANLEFQQDLAPGVPATTLFWKVMAAKAPPALAPAVLAQLGCLGLIYAHRLPVGRRFTADEGENDVEIQ